MLATLNFGLNFSVGASPPESSCVSRQIDNHHTLYSHYKTASALDSKMKRLSICLLSCACPQLLLGQSPQASMFRADLQRTGVFATKGVWRLRGVKWKFKTERVVEAWFSSPSVSNGVLYVGSDD